MSYVFLRFPKFLDKAVTLSYDDASIYDKRLLEIINKYGLKGTFNVNSALIKESDGAWRLTQADIAHIYTDFGHEVAVHGARHCSLADLSDAMIVNEIVNDRRALEEIFQKPITGMAYANGSYDDRVVETIKRCGIDYARTVVSTERFDIPTDWLRMPATCHHNNPRLMQLAKDFLEGERPTYYWSRRPKLFYLWGHSHEFAKDDNWNVIEEFAAYMGGREDVWYATNGEIFEYVRAYDRLVFGVDGTFVYNPSSIDVYINYYDRKYVIPAGKTVDITK